MRSPALETAVEKIYPLGKHVPLSVKTALLRGLGTVVTAETALGRNTIPIEVRGTQLEFVYSNAASMLYFKWTVEDDRISHGMPYDFFDLPSEYDLAIDVGAHFGTYSVLLGGLNELELVAFEPNERNRRVLAMNMVHNEIDATVDERVVSGTSGRTTFYEGTKAASNEHTTTPPDRTKYRARTAETVALSSVIADADADAVFVKIDAEGEEHAIVPDLITCDAEVISGLVEIHSDQLEHHGVDVVEELTENGFHVEEQSVLGNPVYRFWNDAARSIETRHKNQRIEPTFRNT